ncbi:MAG: uracil-DNA glycosylase, partial [Azonexus sp.]|nr:uracil-DNA glycosylase [Azonexus sp.]
MTLSREQMLVEMGISPIWVLRDTLPVGEAIAEQGEAASPVTLAIDTPESVATASASENQLADRSTVIQHTPSSPTPAKASGAWPELLAEIAGCRACVLCEQRKQAVPGVGDQQPDWLFIGEGPGAEEDVKGEPFVGQAGKLLDAMLDALDIARGQKVYIANAVKCRPPGNRTPEAAEMAACKPFLERQIALLKPKIIVLLGKAAV